MEKEELKNLWKKILGILELQISKPNFVTWLKNSALIEIKNDVWVIALPNNFAKE